MTYDRYGHWLGSLDDDHAKFAAGEREIGIMRAPTADFGAPISVPAAMLVLVRGDPAHPLLAVLAGPGALINTRHSAASL